MNKLLFDKIIIKYILNETGYLTVPEIIPHVKQEVEWKHFIIHIKIPFRRRQFKEQKDQNIYTPHTTRWITLL